MVKHKIVDFSDECNSKQHAFYSEVLLAGSLADLVARAGDRPIYCTASPAVNRALSCALTDAFSHKFPDATFVNARTHYRHQDDRRNRWRAERDRYGAAIVLTRAEQLAGDTDPFAGPAGKHAISVWVYNEINALVQHGRPIGWHAVVSPASYWLPRFAVEPFSEVQTGHFALVKPAEDADPFEPIVVPWLHVGHLSPSGC